MMNDLLLKKTRINVVASIVWLCFAFYLADTHTSVTGFFSVSFNFHGISWNVFFISSLPVWIYWAYYWIMKGR